MKQETAKAPRAAALRPAVGARKPRQRQMPGLGQCLNVGDAQKADFAKSCCLLSSEQQHTQPPSRDVAKERKLGADRFHLVNLAPLNHPRSEKGRSIAAQYSSRAARRSPLRSIFFEGSSTCSGVSIPESPKPGFLRRSSNDSGQSAGSNLLLWGIFLSGGLTTSGFEFWSSSMTSQPNSEPNNKNEKVINTDLFIQVSPTRAFILHQRSTHFQFLERFMSCFATRSRPSFRI